jgi:hypothetical protein
MLTKAFCFETVLSINMSFDTNLPVGIPSVGHADHFI